MTAFGVGEPSEDYARDPFATLDTISGACPVRLADREGWAVAGRGPVLAALRDDRLAATDGSTFTDRSPAFRNSVARMLRAWFAHEAERALPELVNEAFADATAHLFAVGQADRVADLVADIARAVPLAVMAALLGVPPTHRQGLGRLAGGLLASYDSGWSESAASGVRSKQGLDGYFILHLTRAEIGAPLLDPLRDIGRKQDLPPAAMADVCTKLLVAGTTTTAGCLASILAWLLEDPAAYRTCAERADTDMPALVEDLIRLRSPILALKRTATAQTTVAGTPVAAGARVYLLTAAANREGGTAVPDCPAAGPTQRHLSFGRGRHACLGAPLARLEIRTALTHLLPLVPRLRLLEPIQWRRAWLLHEPVSIRVVAS